MLTSVAVEDDGFGKSESGAVRAVDAPTSLVRQNHELTVLNVIATALNESADLATSLGIALRHVAELLGFETGWVSLFDEETGFAYLAASQNLPPELAAHPERMEGGCHCLEQSCEGTMRRAASIAACSRLAWLADGSTGLRYHASIPLYVGERKLGVMNVASPAWRELSGEELKLLQTIGEIVGTAVERSRLHERCIEAGVLEERYRLAREIHDTLAQGLSATALQLETAEALLEGGAAAEQVLAVVHRALESTRLNLDEARRSVHDLRSAPLDGRTLVEALRELCSESSGEGLPTIRFDIAGTAGALPARVESALYRIAQEALTNALRHAAARHVSLQLIVRPAAVDLLIEDDGAGFEVDLNRPGRFGLVGMWERARLLGGELNLRSQPGAGTRLAASIPLL